jgi:hypothetical protein
MKALTMSLMLAAASLAVVFTATPASATTKCAVNETACVCLDLFNCAEYNGPSDCVTGVGTDRGSMNGVICGLDIPCITSPDNCENSKSTNSP